MKKRNQAIKYGAGLTALSISTMSNAAIDTKGLVTTIGGVTASTDAVGLAILGVIVAIAVIGWIRRVIR